VSSLNWSSAGLLSAVAAWVLADLLALHFDPAGLVSACTSVSAACSYHTYGKGEYKTLLITAIKTPTGNKTLTGNNIHLAIN
jgi:hypothetical protein